MSDDNEDRRAIIIGHGAQLAVATALFAGAGMRVLTLDDREEDRRFLDLSPMFLEGWNPEPERTRRREQSAAVRMTRVLDMRPEPPRYRNRFLNPVEQAEVIHPEVPLTKRQRRRMKGKK